VENYFNYFTEIEEHFQRRRGSLLILSTLDWALIETWKDAGIPLDAVLRGIDATFDAHERKPSKSRKVNGLGFCTQEVLTAAEQMAEAAVGAVPAEKKETGLAVSEIAEFLNRNAAKLEKRSLPGAAAQIAAEAVVTLRKLAAEVQWQSTTHAEDLERRLTVMEEKIFAALLAATSDDAILAVRTEADRDLAPYRGKMNGPQIEQLHKQYIHKRILERYDVPRLSLFYM
jgi:DNA-binding transcriptional MerR regulator